MTDEETWLRILGARPPWEPPAIPTVIISPHPDDETLGAGALIATQRQRGVPVSIIAVTDGERAYPDWPGLAEVRRNEQEVAATALGMDPRQVVRLRLPDSDVSRHERCLVRHIAAGINANTLVLAPWAHDPHPDHRACGRAAIAAARDTGAMVVFYLFWAWHRNHAESLEHLPLRRFILSALALNSRAEALAYHTSQLNRADGDPILPDIYLAPARRAFETYLVPDARLA